MLDVAGTLGNVFKAVAASVTILFVTFSASLTFVSGPRGILGGRGGDGTRTIGFGSGLTGLLLVVGLTSLLLVRGLTGLLLVRGLTCLFG